MENEGIREAILHHLRERGRSGRRHVLRNLPSELDKDWDTTVMDANIQSLISDDMIEEFVDGSAQLRLTGSGRAATALLKDRVISYLAAHHLAIIAVGISIISFVVLSRT